MKAFRTHIDGDGIGVYVLLKYYGLDREFDSIEAVDYIYEEESVDRADLYLYSEIVMVDLSIPLDFYNELIAMGKKITIIDHHESSLELKGHPNIIHDISMCGTKLFYHYIQKEYGVTPVPIITDFVNLVDTYDLWKEDSELWNEAMNLSRVMYRMYFWGESTPLKQADLYVSRLIKKFRQFTTWVWTPQEQQFIRQALDREDREFKNFMDALQLRTDTKGRIFGVSMLGAKISIVASRYLHENPQVSYVLILNTFKGLNNHMSARSREVGFSLTESFPFLSGHPHACAVNWESMDQVHEFCAGDIWSLAYTDEIQGGTKMWHTIKDLCN